MILWKKIVYYWATLSSAVAYVRLLAIVDKIQKHGGKVCFMDWPALKKTSDCFVDGKLCKGVICPLAGVHDRYVSAKKQHEESRHRVQQAQTSFFCARVKDREQ